jgi:hypothetical protein
MLHTVTNIISSILISAWDRVSKTNPGATEILSEIGAEYHSMVECYICHHSFLPDVD